MTFASKRKRRPIATEYNIKGKNLHSYEKFKDLQVVFWSDLPFIEQIQSKKVKTNRNMGILMRHSKFSSLGTIRMLYLTQVTSVLDFANVAWAPSGKRDSNIFWKNDDSHLALLSRIPGLYRGKAFYISSYFSYISTHFLFIFSYF